MSINTENNNIIKLDFQSNSYINSESSDNNEKKNDDDNKNKNIIQIKPSDIFGDLTSIIRNNIRIKNILRNRNKSIDSKSNSKTSYINYTSPKNIINIHTNSSSKNNSQISLTSHKKTSLKKIKKNSKINPELFINKKKESIKNDKLSESFESNPKKKIKINDMLERFEEESQKAKNKFEKRKKKFLEQEKKIYTGKPDIGNNKLINYEKYSKNFLLRQKELNEESNKKKQKLIDEKNQKQEKEYQELLLNSIANKNKNKKNYSLNKNDDNWVDRLYTQDTKKRKIDKINMEKAFIPSFQPALPKKRMKKYNSMDKNNYKINKVLNEYKKNQNPQSLINYMNGNNIFNKDNEELFRNKIFGYGFIKNKNRKINKSMD